MPAAPLAHAMARVIYSLSKFNATVLHQFALKLGQEANRNSVLFFTTVNQPLQNRVEDAARRISADAPAWRRRDSTRPRLRCGSARRPRGRAGAPRACPGYRDTPPAACRRRSSTCSAAANLQWENPLYTVA